MTGKKELETKINNIKKVFDIEKISSLPIDKSYIRRYYQVNKIPYSLFHSKTDLIYMGISRDGKFKAEDLLAAAKIIAEHIRRNHAKSVLEIATGRGANSFYLAKQFPDVKFFGIDLSEAQLTRARQKAKRLKNYFPESGDYHDLSRYQSEAFDLAFEVEGLCYSTNKEIVLSEIKRVLKQKGLFILFDGYLNNAENEMTGLEKTVRLLIERGMAVPAFESYKSFVRKAESAGFQIVYEENLSEFVVPTMRRFEHLAEIFFRHPRLSRMLAKIFPPEFVYNAVSGYLMPGAMKDKLFCYMLTVARKR